jgi:hypothetical protein
MRVGIPVVVAMALAASVAGCGRSPLMPSPGDDEIVRGGFGTGFAWVTEPGPAIVVGEPDPAALRTIVARSAAAVRADLDDTFSLAVAATFPTIAAAEAEAARLRDVLRRDDAWFVEPGHAAARAALLDPARDAPISEPASTWLSDANLAPGSRGLGWAGPAAGSADPGDAVWTIGPAIFVTGLKAETGASPIPPPIHPIAHRWAAAGADVLLEGDDAGEGSILADLSCRPADAASGATLRDALGETVDLAQWMPLPPWVGTPTAAQAATRAEVATYQGIAQAVSTEPASLAIMTRIASASDAERPALLAALGQRIDAGVKAAAAGRVSQEVLELMARQPRGGDDVDALVAWQREVGERIGTVELRPGTGSPTADAFGPVAIFGTARVREGRFEVGSLALGRVTTGLPLVLAWLTDHGCLDQRIGLADGDP